MRGNKFEKSHIHILESETLSRESRVTESAQEIVGSIPYIHELYTYVYHLSTLLFSLWGRKKKFGYDFNFSSKFVMSVHNETFSLRS